MEYYYYAFNTIESKNKNSKINLLVPALKKFL